MTHVRRSNDQDETRAGSGSLPSSASGWLGESGAIDHGRFTPGDILGDRYRIVGLLGRGGMGEVYRADDLRLGQPVAVKLLPADLGNDPQRLAQFHNEVRMARQVSHAHVCRVHDIGEAHGQLFLTMEFVDGEDLAASLKRVGRFPEDKALELGREICAGLAAAHQRGIIHRDLKPANIMLDKDGHVRLMDFGLASIGTADDVRVGTPAYMAPEQLQGTGVSIRSDIYALGLVLYELFTGRRVFTAKTVNDLIEQHTAGTLVAPGEIVKGLDPAVEATILRCLERDPNQRPASALAVSAALPGGDPLQAALAAGETPSPEMVAAAGADARVWPPAVGLALAAVSLLLLVATASLGERGSLLARVPFDYAPTTLFDRARDLERELGHGGRVVDRASGLATRPDVIRWLPRGRGAQVADASAPVPALFWYRSSPQWLVPSWNAVSLADPPPFQPGMTLIALDTTGALIGFSHAPAPADGEASAVTAPDWSRLFAAARLEPARFTEAAPELTPSVYADTRAAWIGPFTEKSALRVRIEAGSYRGRPVYFNITGPWTRPAGTQAASAAGPSSGIVPLAAVLVVLALMLGAAIAARTNVRRGRGDRRGALHLAAAVMALSLGAWVFQAHHVADAIVEGTRLWRAVAAALFDAALIGLFYLAAEPQVRRIWPHILITWSRLVAGASRDPLLGRDLIVGAGVGALMTVVTHVFDRLPDWFGWTPFDPRVPSLSALLGNRQLLGGFLNTTSSALQNAMLGVLGLALLRQVLKRSSVVFAVATAIFAPLAARGQFQSGNPLLDLAFGTLLVLLILGVLFRFGFVAGFVGFLVHFWTLGTPLTLDPSRQYFGASAVAMAIVAAAIVGGLVLTRHPGAGARVRPRG
jgi:serine/threonine-protein kinase